MRENQWCDVAELLWRFNPILLGELQKLLEHLFQVLQLNIVCHSCSLINLWNMAKIRDLLS